MLNKQYLLDTNIISECTKPIPNVTVLNRIASELRKYTISSISWFELLYGVKRMPEGKRKKSIEQYLYNHTQTHKLLPLHLPITLPW